MAFGVAAFGMIPLNLVSTVEAKTTISAAANNIFFYVTNDDGKNVLLDIMSLNELTALQHGQLSNVTTGTDTGTNYYYSCTDNLPTTVYTEAKGLTIPELVNYVKSDSPVANASALTYAGSDKMSFMATDSNGSYTKNWTCDQLYGESKYYFPGIFDSSTGWNSNWEISDDTYGPTDSTPIPLTIYNSTYKNSDSYYAAKRAVFAGGLTTAAILATVSESGRARTEISSEISANSGAVTGCLKDELTTACALRLCLPQSEAVLMSGNRTAYNYFSWIYNMKLGMTAAPDIPSQGNSRCSDSNGHPERK